MRYAIAAAVLLAGCGGSDTFNVPPDPNCVTGGAPEPAVYSLPDGKIQCPGATDCRMVIQPLSGFRFARCDWSCVDYTDHRGVACSSQNVAIQVVDSGSGWEWNGDQCEDAVCK